MKELGFKQNAYWTWYTNAGKASLMHNPKGCRGFENKSFDAFSVAELGEMLPEDVEGAELRWFHVKGEWWVDYIGESKSIRKSMFTPTDKNEANCRAKMLIYLAENGLINPK